jgi:trigger factor
MNITVKKLPKSEVEIEGEIDASIFESHWAKAVKKIGENIEVDGFRKGKAPENVIVAKAGEMHILEEMAEMTLGEEYPKMLEQEKIDAISRPEIFITKLARNNPLGFRIKTAVMPEIELPDYKGESKKVMSGLTDEDKKTEVTDEDVENTIMDIRKSRAPKVHMAEHTHAEGEEHAHPEPELPEFNDEFVKGLGPFENVADFKEKLKVNIKLEKENQAKEKARIKIMEAILESTKIEIPEILVEGELQKILFRMESDITNMGLKFEDYLTHLKKTKEDLMKDFRPDAEKKAKLALVLNEIAKREKIEPDQQEVAMEVAHLLEHYKDADPERARMHAENVLTNEKIFQFLESQ